MLLVMVMTRNALIKWRSFLALMVLMIILVIMMLTIMILVIMMVMTMIHICDNDAVHGDIIGDNDGDDDNCSS